MGKFLLYIKSKREYTMIIGLMIVIVDLMFAESEFINTVTGGILSGLIWVIGVGAIMFGYTCEYYKNLKILLVFALITPLIYLYADDIIQRLFKINANTNLIKGILCFPYAYIFYRLKDRD